MQKIQIIFFIVCAHFYLAQNILLNKVEKVNDNTDKFLYLLSDGIQNSEYLGEIEVQGFSKDDAAIFSAIYKKAKEIGANSYALKPFETIDGSNSKFDPVHYKLSLYYTEKNKFSEKIGGLYIFASSEKDQKISVDQKDYILSPRSFIEIPVVSGEIYTVSTKKLLGSTIKFQTKNQNTSYYLQVSSSKVKADQSGTGGLNLKSGDIIGLDSSYGDFLRTIYSRQ